jgi:acyl-CoA thioester hydrolase
MNIRNLKQHLAFTQTVLSPQFHDLDPLNIVWHGNYVKYLETARTNLLRRIGYDYAEMKTSGYAWPVVDMRLKYIRTAQYDVPLVVSCAVTEWEHRLKINYEIHEQASQILIHRAYTIQVAVDMHTTQMCYQSPEILSQCLNNFNHSL